MKQVMKVEVPFANGNPHPVVHTYLPLQWIGAEFGLDGLLYVRGIVNTNQPATPIRFYAFADHEAIPQDSTPLEYVGSASHRSHINPRPVHIFAQVVT